jgi:acyl-CoA synthetase (AMP-forming)/AMP-acid ligase II
VPAGPPVASVTELVARSARGKPGHVAVSAGGRAWTYAELWEGARTAATALQRAGVSPGDTVVLALPNEVGFFLAFLGTLIAGGIAVPVFPRSAPERLAGLARLAGASALVGAAGPHANDLGKLAARDGRAFLTLVDLGRGGGAGASRARGGGAGTSRARGGAPVPVPDDPDRPCYIQYTSGSTADPRGVIITHRGLLANIAQMTEAMDITPDDVFVSWLPTYHDMGLSLMALTPFSLGARLVLLPTDLRDVAGWLRAIETHRGTFTAGPDFAYRLCLRNVRNPERFILSSLKVCMNASEPVRAATLAGFEAAFGLRRVMMTGYGLAEATLSVTCTQRGQPIDVDKRGLVCLGRPMPGTTVKIAGPAGPAAGQAGELPAGQVGEIVVAGPSTCTEYHRNPAATAALAWRDGYIRTGDLGYLDGAGRLYFTARQKEVIKLAGRSIYPQEVESLADQVTGVRLSAAVGIDRGGVLGEQLYVFAEVRDAGTATPAALRVIATEIVRALHGALGVRPRSTILLRPRRIPQTANGKLRRATLRDAYTGGQLVPGADILYPPPVRSRAGG